MQHSGGVLLAGQGSGHTMINSIPLGYTKNKACPYGWVLFFNGRDDVNPLLSPKS
jgi:hypothetical protein